MHRRSRGCRQWKKSGGSHSSAGSRGSQRHWAGEGWHLPRAPRRQAVWLLPSWSLTLSKSICSLRQCACCWRRVICLQTVSMLPSLLRALHHVLTVTKTSPGTKSSQPRSKKNQSTALLNQVRWQHSTTTCNIQHALSWDTGCWIDCKAPLRQIVILGYINKTWLNLTSQMLTVYSDDLSRKYW